MRSCDRVTIRGKRILHNMLLISVTLTNAIILLTYKIVLQNILHGTLSTSVQECMLYQTCAIRTPVLRIFIMYVIMNTSFA